MAVSPFDLFEISIGPSSLPTVAPVRAARTFTRRLASEGALGSTERFKCDLHGSRAAGGNEHGVSAGLVLGLTGLASDAVADIPASRSASAGQPRAVVLSGHFLGSSEVDSDSRHHFGIVLVGGQTADDRSQDIRGQTQQALAKIEKMLAAAGTDKSRLLAAQVWLKDVQNDFAGMNGVWDAWMTPHAAAARATAQSEMASPNVLVEISVAAAIGNAEA